MRSYKGKPGNESPIFVGVDLHSRQWHVTVATVDSQLFSGTIAPTAISLRKLLKGYDLSQVEVTYEAGCFGYGLYDQVIGWGARCLVVAPSLVPVEYGNRVKTDKRDSRRLCFLLSRGLLKAVWVPSAAERDHRQVVRRRRQLVRDRVRVQHRIKSELRFRGYPLPSSRGRWSQAFVCGLRTLELPGPWASESFARLLDEFDSLTEQITRQTKLLGELSKDPLYQQKCELLCTIPGVGMITAMDVLTELGDVSRFRRAERLAAYVGLTPSQYSSGDKVRMGRITGIGKNSLRGLLIESAAGQ